MNEYSTKTAYDHPIGPVHVFKPIAMTMPHRGLRFASTEERDSFLTAAMKPFEGPIEADFDSHEAPLASGKYDSFFRKGGRSVLIRFWTNRPGAGQELDGFIDQKLDEAADK